MSQFLSQLPRQLMRQEQRLTPQLIQAMDILQLPTMALEARIAQEVDSNPALEAVSADEDFAVPLERRSRLERTNGTRIADAKDGNAREFERLASLVREYDYLQEDYGYRGGRSRAAAAEDSDAKSDAMANTSARSMSLQEHVSQQWGLLDLDPAVRRAGQKIIEYLDENGFLKTPLAEIGTEMNPPAEIEDLDDALAEIQRLEPAGVGARSLQECLLLQIEALPGDNRLERMIIQDHFDDLQKNRLPQIARALHVDIEEVKQAIAVLGTLLMHPGREWSADDTPPIVPDIVVEWDADLGNYAARLSRGNTRELRISDEFRALLQKKREDKETRDFVRQKIEAASAIIDAVNFRRDRLLEVARAVVEAQRDFLDKGEQFLRPLRMSDLAQRFGCDPSTISRTVDEKYVQTPRGIFPLRRFFSGGAETDSGEVLGWDSIKAKVAEIVEREDKRDPLSDDLIVDELQKQGVDIKRRTVAKYRAQLDIPTARQRRQF